MACESRSTTADLSFTPKDQATGIRTPTLTLLGMAWPYATTRRCFSGGLTPRKRFFLKQILPEQYRGMSHVNSSSKTPSYGCSSSNNANAAPHCPTHCQRNNRMQGPRPEAVNTRPMPRPTATTDPTKATKRPEDFSVPVGVIFIGDVVEEHARVLQEAERRMKREELLDEDDTSSAFNPAKLAANGPQVYFGVSVVLNVAFVV